MIATLSIPGLAPDPLLARRDELLDIEALTEHLGRVLEPAGITGVVSAERSNAKYRWGESLRVVMRVVHDRGEVVVAGRMFASERRAADAATAAGRGAVLDRDFHTVWFVYPDDRRLRHLARMSEPHPDLALPGGPWVGTELVQYAPERSATFRALGPKRSTLGFAKLYRHAEDAAHHAVLYDSAADHFDRLGTGARVPRALGVDDALGVLVLEPMAGGTWNELPADRLAATCARIGAAVAHLHDLPQLARRPFERLRPDHVRTAAEIVAAARPDVAPSILALTARLLASAPTPSAPVLLHGDLHPANVLVGDDVALIDLDQAGWGPAAHDLGALIARFRQGAAGSVAAAELEAAVLDGYSAVRPMPNSLELDWSVRAALVVERALRAVTRLHPVGLAALPDTIATAWEGFVG